MSQLLICVLFFICLSSHASKWGSAQTEALQSPISSYPSSMAMCTKCPLGLVCYNDFQVSASVGYCVNTCLSCRTRLCQICNDGGTIRCGEAGVSSCRIDSQCCGSSNGYATCSAGQCRIPLNNFCWESSQCVEGLICKQNTCTLSSPVQPPSDSCSKLAILQNHLKNFELQGKYLKLALIATMNLGTQAKGGDPIGAMANAVTSMGLQHSTISISPMPGSSDVSLGAATCEGWVTAVENEMKRLCKVNLVYVKALYEILSHCGQLIGLDNNEPVTITTSDVHREVLSSMIFGLDHLPIHDHDANNNETVAITTSEVHRKALPPIFGLDNSLSPGQLALLSIGPIVIGMADSDLSSLTEKSNEKPGEDDK